MKVMFLTNIPSPYRVKFWDMLGKRCELTVVFESYNESNRQWDVQVGTNFKSVFLKGFSVATQFHINPGIIKHIKKFKYDVIVISGYNSPTDMMVIDYLIRHNIPFIFSADGGFKKTGGNPLVNDIKRYFISNADLYMASGTMCEEYLISNGAPKDKIRKYYLSSITNDDFDEPISLKARVNTIKKNYGLKEKVVIGVGQFIPRKGFDILLDVWGHVRRDDTTLLIVGGGPKEKQYKKIIAEKNLKNVKIIGFLPKSKLFELYRISDLFVFPTIYDIWGMTLGEAMACSLPVVSSANAAASYDLVYDGENGYMESVNHPITWARRIEEILSDDELRAKFAKASKAIMRNYTIEHMVEDYMSAFKEMLPRGNQGI